MSNRRCGGSKRVSELVRLLRSTMDTQFQEILDTPYGGQIVGAR